jgi:hypothetical protein
VQRLNNMLLFHVWKSNHSFLKINYSRFQNQWVFGLCPLSSILKTQYNILETGSASVLRWGEGHTYSVGGPLERANFDCWTSPEEGNSSIFQNIWNMVQYNKLQWTHTYRWFP